MTARGRLEAVLGRELADRLLGALIAATAARSSRSSRSSAGRELVAAEEADVEEDQGAEDEAEQDRGPEPDADREQARPDEEPEEEAPRGTRRSPG